MISVCDYKRGDRVWVQGGEYFEDRWATFIQMYAPDCALVVFKRFEGELPPYVDGIEAVDPSRITLSLAQEIIYAASR